MSLKSAQYRLNGKYPMLSYILFFSLIFGFQFGFAMEVDQVEVGQEVNQDELNQQLIAAVHSYYDRNQQATVVDRVNDLLNRGANPNILMDRAVRSPLLYLLIIGNGYENRPVKRRLMELLIRAGADPNCRIIEDDSPISSNTTPLSWSCAVEDRAIFDLLVEHGADIRQRCKNNKTLLHEAARCWNPELCEFLLREGLDVNAVDDNGNIPLHSLCDQDFVGDGVWSQNIPDNIPAVIELLLDWGAQINLQNNRGMSLHHREMTPLHLAVAWNVSRASARPAVRVLLARGADLNLLCQRDYNSSILVQNPLELAVYVQNTDSKRDYKEQRRLCELMMTHQVLVNKGTLTLLCSLRKMGLEGNDGARTLYRYRGQLLTPYLRQLYRPLQELLQRPNLWGEMKIDAFAFKDFQGSFPKSNFNIDFLDQARIPETYKNLNRNIYRGLHQPRLIGLAESNSVLINNNNNEPHREELFVGAPTLAPDDPDSYDDYSDDDDDNNIRPILEAYNHDRALRCQNELGMHPPSLEANDAKEQPAPKVPQLNSNNSNIPLVVFAIGFYGAVGYTLYKCYTNWKKRIEKEKKKKKEGRNKKGASLVASAPEIVYA